MTKERPILFNSQMVCAILAGKKTQTRRPLKPQPDVAPVGQYFDAYRGGERGASGERAATGACFWTTDNRVVSDSYWTDAPAELGDVLWVRETWRTEELPSGEDGVRFAADDAFVPIANTEKAADDWCVAHNNGKRGLKWCPSIHMPRWAARIRLEVTDVSLERVQSITEEEARAEGIEKHNARDEFVRLWDRIYGPHSWTLDDYVWALTFRLR